MPIAPIPAVTLTPVAYFPEGYFLENLAVRADGSVLITAVPKGIVVRSRSAARR